MILNALGVTLLLSVCGLRFVVGVPSWITKYEGKTTLYAEDGQDITFRWRFNRGPGSPSREFSQWQFLKPPTYVPVNIATLLGESTGQPTKSGTYANRVVFQEGEGQAGFTLKNLKAADKGRYQCSLNFPNAQSLADVVNLQVVVRPLITSSSKDRDPISLDEGQSTTLLCDASGHPTPTFWWFRDGVEVKKPDPANKNYVIANAGRNDKGTYKCEARVNAGPYNFKAEYTVYVKVTYKPVVTVLTSNQTIVENTNYVDFDCTAEGEPAVSAYYWYKGKGTTSQIQKDSKFDLLNGNQRFRIRNLKKEDANWYTCAARNSRGLGAGKSSYLRILYAPKTVSISFNPSSIVDSYGTVTLTCQSDGEPTPSFTWRFNHNQVMVGTGERGKNLLVNRAMKDDAGNYSCKATNTQGFKERTELLYVKYAPTTVKMNTGTDDNGAILGRSATLTCKADGFPAPTYEIKRDNTRVHGPAVTGVYVINAVKYTDENVDWYCIATNEKGARPSAKISISVQVVPVIITGLPQVKEVKTENQTGNYTCTSDGKPAPKVIWFVNDANVTGDTPYLGKFTEIGGLNPNQPKLIRVTSTLAVVYNWRHYGNISCVAKNIAGFARETTALEIRHCPVVKTAAHHPKNVTLDDGQSGTFTCTTIGNPLTLYNEWYFNGVLIPNSRGNSYTRSNVGLLDAGVYSCRGVSTLCPQGGPLFGAHLLIKTAPKITYYPPVTSANETYSALLYCRVTGVPDPVVTWTKEGNSTILHTGNEFIIGNLTHRDSGHYICLAKNSEAQTSAKLELKVRVVPVITTDKPTDTQIAGEIGKTSPIRCSARAEPRAEYWWTRGTSTTPLIAGSERIKSMNDEGNSRVLVVEVSAYGEKYHCHARNIMGKDIQQFTIREKGPPDAPINIKVVGIVVPKKRTVDVDITWTAGYSGGFPQSFTVLHKLASAVDFTSTIPDSGNQWRLTGLKPWKAYDFMLRSQNIRGLSPNSVVLRYTTPESALPPARGTVTVVRNPDDGTQFFISWTIGENVTATYLQYREKLPISARKRRATTASYSRWMDVQGAQGLSRNDTEFTVVNLDASKTYQFRGIFLYPGESLATISDKMWVESDEVAPLPIPGKRTSGLSTDELIAIIGGCGGVLLILVVILCLCCFKKRKKPYGADSVEMSQTANGLSPYTSYASGGPDITRVNSDGRRSYGGEDVEDDPFIEAHLASVAAVDGKKKKRPDPTVNYGYASQGLRGMSQSMGQLDSGRGSYPASGPQRDAAATLPPYTEPPSFEEALRQSGRKPKNKNRSTGDLADNLRPLSDETDSSDNERYYKPKPLKIRPADSDEDPGYSSVDVLNGQRRSAPGPPRRAHNGPLDPSVPYARPMVKSKPKHRPPPASQPNDPTRDYDAFPTDPFEDELPWPADNDDFTYSWPPPQYSAEDRAPIPGIEDDYEPRVNRRRPYSSEVLELDRTHDYRGNDRLPDLPPRMPELSNSRGMLHKEPIHDNMPEPPSFLRDIPYQDDDDYDPYLPTSRSYTEPRTPTSRSRQPYVNIHGELVRPGSQGSDLNRNDPVRLSSSALEPEPEPRRGRSGGNDDRNHEVGYVSSGFLV